MLQDPAENIFRSAENAFELSSDSGCSDEKRKNLPPTPVFFLCFCQTTAMHLKIQSSSPYWSRASSPFLCRSQFGKTPTPTRNGCCGSSIRFTSTAPQKPILCPGPQCVHLGDVFLLLAPPNLQFQTICQTMGFFFTLLEISHP